MHFGPSVHINVRRSIVRRCLLIVSSNEPSNTSLECTRRLLPYFPYIRTRAAATVFPVSTD